MPECVPEMSACDEYVNAGPSACISACDEYVNAGLECCTHTITKRITRALSKRTYPRIGTSFLAVWNIKNFFHDRKQKFYR